MKEAIIIIIVILLVAAGSVFMQKYLVKTSDELIGILEEMKQDIGSKENSEKVNELLEKWDEINKIWSMIIIHEELDNIEVSMLGVKGAIESEDTEYAIEELERTIFLVGHIKEKEAFKLKNIF